MYSRKSPVHMEKRPSYCGSKECSIHIACTLQCEHHITQRAHCAQKSKSKELFHATCTVRTKEPFLTCTGLFLEFIRLVQLYIWLFPIHAALSAIHWALSRICTALTSRISTHIGGRMFVAILGLFPIHTALSAV